jgi:hypothetical protein
MIIDRAERDGCGKQWFQALFELGQSVLVSPVHGHIGRDDQQKDVIQMDARGLGQIQTVVNGLLAALGPRVHHVRVHGFQKPPLQSSQIRECFVSSHCLEPQIQSFGLAVLPHVDEKQQQIQAKTDFLINRNGCLEHVESALDPVPYLGMPRVAKCGGQDHAQYDPGFGFKIWKWEVRANIRA